MLKIDKNCNYLLACSNGPDSMALFYLLLKEGYKFSVTHVNYHLRKESNDEERKLKEYCLKNNIEIYVYDCKEKINKNIEEKCREIRYGFFNDLSKKYHFDAVLVAHHEDDLLETYLLQKQRKNIPNAYGISEIVIINDCKIIRPLLSYKKDELIKTCNDNNVPYSIDSSNLSDQYERNKIRHHIISKLTDEDRKELINKISEENARLSSYKTHVDNITDNSIVELNKLNDLEFAMYLTKIAKNIDKNIEISLKFAIDFKKQMNSKKSSFEIKIKNNIYLCKEYEKINLRKFENIDYSYKIDKPDILDTPYFYLNFKIDSSNRNVKLDDYPLIICNAKNNDVCTINGYKCKLRRMFIDWKMPKYLRIYWPVIKNKSGIIIYVPRYQVHFVKDDSLNFYVKDNYL